MPTLSHVDTFFLLTKQLKDKLDNQTGAKHTSKSREALNNIVKTPKLTSSQPQVKLGFCHTSSKTQVNLSSYGFCHIPKLNLT